MTCFLVNAFGPHLAHQESNADGSVLVSCGSSSGLTSFYGWGKLSECWARFLADWMESLCPSLVKPMRYLSCMLLLSANGPKIWECVSRTSTAGQ